MINLLKKFQGNVRRSAVIDPRIERAKEKYGDKNLTRDETYEIARLLKLVDTINADEELRSTAGTGSCLMVLSSGEQTSAGGWGTNLILDKNGLYIYDWDDYNSRRNEIKDVNPKILKYFPHMADADKLQSAVMEYLKDK